MKHRGKYYWVTISMKGLLVKHTRCAESSWGIPGPWYSFWSCPQGVHFCSTLYKSSQLIALQCNPTPRIALSVRWSVRHKIWSYFQWDCSLNLVSARTQSSWIHASHYGYMHHGHICVGHTAWAPEGREGRSQGGPKGRRLEVWARRAPKLLVRQ